MKSSPLPPDLAEPLTRSVERLGRFGRHILYYETVASTNDVAASLAEGGAPEGCVIVAEAQTAGRGRLGRAWASPRGAGLYLSSILRPEADIAPLITIAAGVAVARGIEAATGLQADLKWPNDVFIANRKVAGILAEGRSHVVILGVGINVVPAVYPADVITRATTLQGELGRPVCRGTLLVECLAAFASQYTLLRAGGSSAVLDAWRTHGAVNVGRNVRCIGIDGILEGTVEDVDARGALLVRTVDGVARVISGEVTWL